MDTSGQDEVNRLLGTIRATIRKVPAHAWAEHAFSRDKALVSALFSRLAYAHIPQYELDSSKGVKIVPSELYQLVFAERITLDMRALLTASDLGGRVDVFIASNRGAVAIGVKTDLFIVVAIRGTRLLYLSDWVIDFRARMIHPYGGEKAHLGFHSGFFHTIQSLRWDIIQSLRSWPEGMPVIVTGHSLGGAMAAILYGMEEFRGYWPPSTGPQCYTFGMPRYGNALATCMQPYPFHTYHLKDPVPRLPPALLGFAAADQLEYCVDEKLVPGCAPRRPLLLKARLGEHRIEAYIAHMQEFC
ncbi:MAG TPA: lipase family protein [Noviherbaspirillum sp.]|uniref:lipase family protein n=1 Tax=Noviherbaspirillum sp. TaxID=1926288 RepID=UPI002B4A482E|nr:lipase family protein [Noviherbaspirillum sp.]HJV85980.1 lipase family protein [Noviherbaspirillum sp.]